MTGFKDRVIAKFREPGSPVRIYEDFTLKIRSGRHGVHYVGPSTVRFYILHTLPQLTPDEKQKIRAVLGEAFQMAVLFPSETEFLCVYETPRLVEDD